MNGKKTIWFEQVALNILRIVTGLLFFFHGIQKLFGVLGRDQPVEFFTLYGLAGAIETVGGAMILLGLFSRPVAFILSGEMAWAYFMVHAPGGVWPIINQGELAALYSFIFLYIAARGGGVFSIDGIRKLRKGPKAGKELPPTDTEVPELTEEDLAPDPEIAELLGEDPKSGG